MYYIGERAERKKYIMYLNTSSNVSLAKEEFSHFCNLGQVVVVLDAAAPAALAEPAGPAEADDGQQGGAEGEQRQHRRHH